MTLRAKMALALGGCWPGWPPLLVGVTTYVSPSSGCGPRSTARSSPQADALADTDGRSSPSTAELAAVVAPRRPGEGFERLGGVVAQCLDGDGDDRRLRPLGQSCPSTRTTSRPPEGARRPPGPTPARSRSTASAYRVTTVPIEYSSTGRGRAAGP